MLPLRQCLSYGVTLGIAPPFRFYFPTSEQRGISKRFYFLFVAKSLPHTSPPSRCLFASRKHFELKQKSWRTTKEINLPCSKSSLRGAVDQIVAVVVPAGLMTNYGRHCLVQYPFALLPLGDEIGTTATISSQKRISHCVKACRHRLEYLSSLD